MNNKIINLTKFLLDPFLSGEVSEGEHTFLKSEKPQMELVKDFLEMTGFEVKTDLETFTIRFKYPKS